MINLLPQKEKEELEIERKTRITIIVGILFLIFLIFLGLLFFSAKIYILSQIQEQKALINIESRSTETPQVQELEKSIAQTNQIISQLNSFYNEQDNVSEILKKVADLLPSDIYLTDFFYKKDKSQVILQGYAQKRESLLGFKKSLESQKEVKNLYSPISNLTKSTDVDFYFSFNISNKK